MRWCCWFRCIGLQAIFVGFFKTLIVVIEIKGFFPLFQKVCPRGCSKTPLEIRDETRQWLTNNPGWLLVFDDVEDYEDMANYIPATGGQIIITSRNTAGHWENCKRLEIKAMTDTEARQLVQHILQQSTPQQNETDDNIDTLCKALSYYPLALVMAAHYLRNHPESIDDFLESYKNDKTDWLSKEELAEDHMPAVRMFKKILGKITNPTQQHYQYTEEVARYAAFLAPQAIPKFWLAETFKTLHSDIPENNSPLDPILSCLCNYHILEREDELDYYTMHSVLQTILRANITDKVTTQRYLLVLDVYVNNSVDFDDYSNCQRYKPHVEALLSHQEKNFGEKAPEIARSLFCLGSMYDVMRTSHQAVVYLDRALAIKKNLFGKDHYEVAPTLVNLGSAYGTLGNPAQQKILLERALAIQENHFGEDHLEVAVTLVNLGNAYRNLGNPTQAKILLERALAIDEKHFGKDHYVVAKTLVNLSNAYGTLGNFAQQKILLERALPILEKHLGKDHYEVAATLGNLGSVYRDLGNPAQQKILFERALAIEEKFFGKDHYVVAKTLNNLGSVYGDLENPAQKKILLERALTIKEEHFGKDHYEVAQALNNLANACGDLGNHTQKKILLERALIIQEKHFGKDHYEIAPTLNNLANAYGDLGNPAQKKILLERALIILEKYLGKDHYEVAKILNNLANAYGALGNPAQKKILLERALTILEKHFGKDHYVVAKTLNDLANAYRALGNLAQAKTLSEHALTIKEKHFGKDHYEVAIPLINLGNVCIAQGELSLGKNFLLRALAILKNQLGENHPHTQLVKNQLKAITTSPQTPSTAPPQNSPANSSTSASPVPSQEQLFRRAAAADNLDDLQHYIHLGIQVDCQDINPTNKKTALHWTVIKNAERCFIRLLEAGANPSIADASGKTAFDYARELNREIMLKVLQDTSTKRPALNLPA